MNPDQSRTALGRIVDRAAKRVASWPPHYRRAVSLADNDVLPYEKWSDEDLRHLESDPRDGADR